ncbi:MAG: hypothetical protein ACOX8R_06285 [Bacillota bacterium]|jgi:hypothetical protein
MKKTPLLFALAALLTLCCSGGVLADVAVYEYDARRVFFTLFTSASLALIFLFLAGAVLAVTLILLKKYLK